MSISYRFCSFDMHYCVVTVEIVHTTPQTFARHGLPSKLFKVCYGGDAQNYDA